MAVQVACRGATWTLSGPRDAFNILRVSEKETSMDIKNVKNIFNTTLIKSKSDTQRKSEIRSGESTERDANGQSSRQGKEQHDFTEEDRRKVLMHLQQLSGVKDNNLIVRLQPIDNKYFVIVEDSSGKVIRRINIQELSHLLRDKDQSKGNILNKAL